MQFMLTWYVVGVAVGVLLFTLWYSMFRKKRAKQGCQCHGGACSRQTKGAQTTHACCKDTVDIENIEEQPKTGKCCRTKS